MDDMIMMDGFGLILLILGLLLLRRENRIFKNSITTQATVAAYYDYQNYDGPTVRTMYTMAVEYVLPDGQVIHAREQSGSASKGFPIGTKISVAYSVEKPDMFTITGDNSRKKIMIGMIVFGALMIVVFTYFGIKASS